MKSTTKRISYLVVVFGLVIVNYGLIRSIIDTWNKQSIVKDAKAKLEIEKQESLSLKKQFSYVQSNAFIENEARDKLFLVRPGESEVLIPKDLLSSSDSKVSSLPSPTWKQWLNLFLN